MEHSVSPDGRTRRHSGTARESHRSGQADIAPAIRRARNRSTDSQDSSGSRMSRLSRRVSRVLSLRRAPEVIPVRDLILMNEINEDNVVAVLKRRYEDEEIYTYVGSVVVSVNPYRNLAIYDEHQVARYRGGNYWDPSLSPHVFALTDSAYSDLRFKGRNQCVIISGESGSGKTEASKVIMRYVAAVSPSGAQVDEVKTKLLKTNPVLEAFGNAKTVRNDNSSRFGKYMDIQFDYHGNPVGGNITTYLLEKARLVRQNPDERCFHIFYQMLAGGQLNSLQMDSDPNHYRYLNQGKCVNCTRPRTYDLNRSLKFLGFSKEDESIIFRVLGAVLLLGQLDFIANGEGSTVSNRDCLEKIGRLLKGDPQKLEAGLSHNTVVVEGKLVSSLLNREKASYACETLAKSLYERLFGWLCTRMNETLCVPSDSVKAVIGVLDIYGFEILHTNGFEQFCINYCNEKLQQLFIELTLKTEQEEYNAEGITWVDIKYFNNRVICDLVDRKPNGIIALLDEECIRPGDRSDESWLSKMDQAIGQHGHYRSQRSTKDRKMPQNVFVMKHYAGDVVYTISSFVDKNMDTLFKDLSQSMFECDNPLLKQLFPDGDTKKWLGATKRPETAGSSFKKSMASMIGELNSKTPSYIRCIKPNEKKRPNVFDSQLVLKQVRYLGLVENVRVRRAGYCYRAPQDKFLDRFKLVCPHTYPVWDGSTRDGIHEVFLYIGIVSDEFEFGRTKIFIKNPQIVFKLESARDAKIEAVVRKLQLAWRAFVIRRRRGEYIDQLMDAFKFIKTDAKFGRDFQWPRNVPRQLISGDLYLKKVHANWWAWKKLSLIPEKLRDVLRIRVYAWRCLRGDFQDRQVQQDELSKPLDINQPLGPYHAVDLPGYEAKTQALCTRYGDTNVFFSTQTGKLNRSGKLDRRVLLLTNRRLYKMDTKFKVTPKRSIELSSIQSISLNKTPDSFAIIRVKTTGQDSVFDLGFTSKNLIGEFVAHLFLACQRAGNKLCVNIFDGVVEYDNSQKAAGGAKALTFRADSTARDPGDPVCRYERQTVLYSLPKS